MVLNNKILQIQRLDGSVGSSRTSEILIGIDIIIVGDLHQQAGSSQQNLFFSKFTMLELAQIKR